METNNDRENLNKNLEDSNEQRVINLSERIEEAFGMITPSYLREMGYKTIVELSHAIGVVEGRLTLEDCESITELPNYQKAISRLDTLKNKVYREAERRDRGF